MSHVVRFRDRDTGQMRQERVFGESQLKFLYHTAIGRFLVQRVLRRECVNHLYGWFQRRAGSRRKIQRFVEKLGIDVNEAEKPLQEYRSLDEFFTRRLKPGTRPVDFDPRHLVSPADGRALVYPVVDRALGVKGSQVTLEQLVDCEDRADRFRGGSAIVVRLAPADYHRFHFPESGVASAPLPAGRGLHSVHPIALASHAPSFLNKRMITSLQSDNFGEILQIEVGALLVGEIIESYQPGRVERGLEKGWFQFGGSTVILLARAGRVRFDTDLVEASAAEVETMVKVGTRIGRQP